MRLFHEDAAADNGDSDRHLERYIEMLDRGGLVIAVVLVVESWG